MKTLKGIEVFAVGKWNGMTFQAHDLAAMVEAFNALKDVHKVPLKLGHNSEQPVTDGKPALGWVTALYVKAEKLVADFSDVPAIVAKAIDKKLYRRVSLELSIDVRYKGNLIPFVVDAVALLGADLPAVNTLADLDAYLSRDAAEFSVTRRAAFSAVAGSLQERNMDEKEVQSLVEAKLAPIKADFAKVTGERDTLQNENTALKQQVEQFKAAEAKTKIESKRTRVKDVLEGLTASGHMLPAQREAFTKMLGVDDDKRVLDIDVDGLIASFGAKESVGANGKASFAKAGAGDTDPPENDGEMTFEKASEVLDQRASKLVAEGKAESYSAAKQAVLTEDAKLALVYAAGPKAE